MNPDSPVPQLGLSGAVVKNAFSWRRPGFISHDPQPSTTPASEGPRALFWPLQTPGTNMVHVIHMQETTHTD